MTARAILKFEVVPAVLLLSRDADTCEDRYTLLYVAVQKEDSVIAKILLKYSPAELLYTENSVGQTPLDIASFNGLPRLTVRGITGPTDLSLNTEQYAPQKIMLFNEEKQKVEIPKLRATLDELRWTRCSRRDASHTAPSKRRSSSPSPIAWRNGTLRRLRGRMQQKN